MTARPDLTIVIPTYNRRDAIARLLRELDRHEGPAFEVVVAIDGGTDDTPAVVEAAQTSYPVRWIDTEVKGYGLAVARNAGIIAARGKVVVVVDDDGMPRRGFLAAHFGAARPGVISAGPRDPSEADQGPVADRMRAKMAALRELPDGEPMAIPRIRRDYPRAYLIENNISMLREDWIAMGLFSERLKIYGYIGLEFFARATHLGLRYQFVHDAGIVHHGELEGDNGLTRVRKLREARRARFAIDALTTPCQFAAQIAWARARADGQPPPPFPAWLPASVAALPGRAIRAAWRRTRGRFPA